MVGKIKRIRQKLHQDAVKVGDSGLEKAPLLSEAKAFALPGDIKPFDVDKTTNKNDSSKGDTFKGSFPAGIFAGTKISAETLVQTLKYDEPPKSTPLTTSQPAGGGEKRQQTKKERMKERRERWLNKISAIKTAREQHVAQAKRKATPVVGDMRPLVDALPELSQLTASTGAAMATASTSTPSSSRAAKRAKADKAATKKRPPGSINLSKMKPAQKRKLVASEVTWFSEAVKSSSLKSSGSSVNPLAAITEHLRKRLKQEEEQSS